MLELSQFNLQLPLAGPCAAGEDVQDQHGSIQDLAFEHSLKIATLRRAQFVVEDDGIHLLLSAEFGEFLGLSAADESRRDGGFEALKPVPDHLTAGGIGQLSEFVEGVAQFPGGARPKLRSDQEDSFCSVIRCRYESFQ
jgi:hypothetical protein